MLTRKCSIFLHATFHIQNRCKSLKQTDEQNNKHTEKLNNIRNTNVDYWVDGFYR